MWFQGAVFQAGPSDLTRTVLNLSIFRWLSDVLQSVKCFANYLGGLAGVGVLFLGPMASLTHPGEEGRGAEGRGGGGDCTSSRWRSE